MSGLLPLHALDHRQRPGVAPAETIDMSLQVLLDLALGLGEKSEIPALAQPARGKADRERSRVPQGVEQAQPAAELAHALGTPGEMIGLLARRLGKRALDVFVRRPQGLATIER